MWRAGLDPRAGRMKLNSPQTALFAGDGRRAKQTWEKKEAKNSKLGEHTQLRGELMTTQQRTEKH